MAERLNWLLLRLCRPVQYRALAAMIRRTRFLEQHWTHNAKLVPSWNADNYPQPSSWNHPLCAVIPLPFRWPLRRPQNRLYFTFERPMFSRGQSQCLWTRFTMRAYNDPMMNTPADEPFPRECG